MDLNSKSLNYIKAISSEIIMKANSGHTGVALGGATILYALFKDHLKFDVSAQNINRDRFVLSAGHASALYYTILYAFGFDVSLEQLENFRQVGSVAAGHPEFDAIKGIDATTGPLGQGVAMSVGLAISMQHYKKLFNVQKGQIFDNKVYCFMGDGCLMEGVAQEALSLAGSLKINNLIMLYDYNKITIDGSLENSNMEDVGKKYAAMGFNVIYVSNGNDYKQVTKAIGKAKKEKQKPSMIIFRTKIGFGSAKENTKEIHGVPLTKEEFEDLKKKLGITTSMFIPNAVLKFCRQSTIKNNEKFEEWKKNLFIYQNTHPELYKQLANYELEPKIQVEKTLKMFQDVDNISGRDANKKIFNEIANKIPSMIGGSADLASSTKVYIEKGKDITTTDFSARNIFFGVREHAMGAVCNGISLFNLTRSFNSTFLAFSQYMMPAIRLSAMMKLPVWYYFTHDSIFIGEDGPTHQPIEQLGQLRLIPDLNVFRPADPVELIACYNVALKTQKPAAFVLSRQNLPVINKEYNAEIERGAYLHTHNANAKITFVASGSEVSMCLEASKLLEKENIFANIISVPSTSVFNGQKTSYKSSLLKNNTCLIAVEASNDNYWYRITKNIFGLETFGLSGKGQDVAKKLGFTAKELAKYAKEVVKQNCNKESK